MLAGAAAIFSSSPRNSRPSLLNPTIFVIASGLSMGPVPLLEP